MIRAGAVAGLCCLGGAIAGIAGSAAAPVHPKGRAHSSQVEESKHAVFSGAAGAFGIDGAGPGTPDGGPVHSEVVLPTKEESGFETITTDRGSFQSLSGDQLTITEGTKKAAYKTLTLTIPAGATVYRNDEKAQLSDIQGGDEVMVIQTPGATTVTAADAQHEQKPTEVGGPSGPTTKIAPGSAPDGPPPGP
jgi:hypothetical protein